MTILAICFASGLLLGGVSLRSLQQNVDCFIRGRVAARALARQMLRLVALAALLGGMARLGAAPLLATAAGLLLSRIWLVSRMVRP